MLNFQCFPHPSGLTFKCPNCNKWHIHGAEPGTRVAHCVNINYQYYIEMYTISELKTIAKWVKDFMELRKLEKYS